MQKTTFAGVVSAFGAEARDKLDNPAISGAPEDQLRAPLERLFHELADLDDLAPGGLSLIGETTLSHLLTRPDYAVSVNNALVGFIEVKAPSKGCDPRKFSDPHDKAQWGKLSRCPISSIRTATGSAFGATANSRENRAARRRGGNLRRKAEGSRDVARARGGLSGLGAATANQRQGPCAYQRAPLSPAPRGGSGGDGGWPR